MSQKATISLGSNWGNRSQYIQAATESIKKLGKIIKTSSILHTLPIGYTYQPPFLNQLLVIQTELSPHKLLKGLQEIEKQLGRTRLIKMGPRCIDLDIIYFGDTTINTKELQIPHPAVKTRKYLQILLQDLLK